MVIGINGSLYETNKIYKIGEVTYYYVNYRLVEGKIRFTIKFRFVIQFFNGKNEIIEIMRDIDADIDENDLMNYKKAPLFKEALNEVESFKQSIVDVWSNNQSDIPQFNIK